MMMAVVYMRVRWQERQRERERESEWERMEEIMGVTAAGHTDGMA